jgi:uncharacterized protein (UPF0332 family)
VNDGLRSVHPSRTEITRLLAIAARDLNQARFENLHLDTRFSLAYNAALQLATVTLRLHGIRVRKTAFHQRTFSELGNYVDSECQDMAAYFDRARRKRNIVAYEQSGAVSEREVSDLVQQVERFRTWVEHEIEKRMPDSDPLP